MHRRVAPGIAAICVLFLAGCVAPASTSPHVGAASINATPVNLTRPAITAPAFLPPLVLGDTPIGAEDSVAVAPDGTTYVATPIDVWRSDDMGKTFQPLGTKGCGLNDFEPVPLPDCGPYDTTNPGLSGPGDGALAVSPNGTVWWAGLGGRESIPVQYSLDKGKTWSKPWDAARGNSTDREWIVTDSLGHVFVSWRDFDNSSDTKCSGPAVPALQSCQSPPAMVDMRVLANGSWSPVLHVAPDRHEGPIVSDPASGWIYLPLSDGVVSVARSHDMGKTWQMVNLTGTPALTHIFPVMTADTAGTLYLAYSADPNSPTNALSADPTGLSQNGWLDQSQVFVSVSHDHGATWSKPMAVSPAGHTAIFPWVTAGAPGRVAVAWYEGTLGTPNERLPDVWHVAVAMSTTADAASPTWKSSFVSETPNHIGSICTQGGLCLLTGGDRSLLDFFEMRLLPDGSPVLAFSADAPVRIATAQVQATRMTNGTSLR
ncbi:MAG: sialidase family protein [Thermoplasmatota archaeon]